MFGRSKTRAVPAVVPDPTRSKKNQIQNARHPQDSIQGLNHSLILRPAKRSHPQRSRRWQRSLGRFLIQTLLPDATIPSPHADDQQRPKRQEADESEPAFCSVHIGRDGFDLIGEEIG